MLNGSFSKYYNLHQPQMPFLDHVLQVPTYGWKDNDGNLVKPSKRNFQRILQTPQYF
jgi:stearoyl-CoA desaturase (delta-9 desaturase)